MYFMSLKVNYLFECLDISVIDFYILYIFHCDWLFQKASLLSLVSPDDILNIARAIRTTIIAEWKPKFNEGVDW
jgi:hypothetical protein